MQVLSPPRTPAPPAMAEHRRGLSAMPTFPSLAPKPGVPELRQRPPRDGSAPGQLAAMLVPDYGVRVLVIGAAAWFSARWLAAPVRRLVGASRSLNRNLGGPAGSSKLSEKGATVEVREAAQVFNEMAEQLQGQFRSRGLLMASVSHDLRTPLTRMRIRLEALAGQPEAQRCIADIREMDALIDTALQIFRDSHAHEALQSTDIFALVQSLSDDLQAQGQALTLQGTSVVMPVQPAALRRVMSNLSGNALRYGVRATVCVLPNSEGAVIVVEDQGPGIPQPELEAVFQPFYRVEASRSPASGGIGLGLYIARDLRQRQGRQLRLSNRPGRGIARRGAAGAAARHCQLALGEARRRGPAHQCGQRQSGQRQSRGLGHSRGLEIDEQTAAWQAKAHRSRGQRQCAQPIVD